MLSIPFELSRFPASIRATIVSPLRCNWIDVLWAAITVGRRRWQDVIMHGQYSDYEIRYRCYMVLANLMEGALESIVRSPAYDGLDPSEKGAVSYFTGLTLGKLFCEQFLNIPWMMHLEVYERYLSPIIYKNDKRPDLIGLDSMNRWTVLETKGRTNGKTAALINSAKDQTRAIRRIRGQLPRRRLALISHFTDGILEAYWKDPDGYDEDASDLDLRRNDFLADYYRPFLDLIERYGQRKRGEESTASLQDLDMTIGIEQTTFRLLNEERYNDVRIHLKDLPTDPTDDPKYKRGKDGIIITIGPRWIDSEGKLVPPKVPFKVR